MYLPKQCHYVVRVFMELFDFFIPDWCTHLAHGGDDIRGEPLDVNNIVVSLLTNQVHVQHLHDLGPHAVGTRIEERQQRLTTKENHCYLVAEVVTVFYISRSRRRPRLITKRSLTFQRRQMKL